MWHGMLWWWLVPLACFLFARGRRRRWEWRESRLERDIVTDLRQQVESQRQYIDELEARLSRVEDGLEFTERLLAGDGRGGVST
jgi:hypothetical protein